MKELARKSERAHKELKRLQKQYRQENTIHKKENTHFFFHEPTVVVRGRLRSHVLTNKGRR